MSFDIGSVEIPFVSSMDADTNIPESEVKGLHGIPPAVATHQPDNARLTIEFVIAQKVHSQGLSVSQQRQNIQGLAETDQSNNRIQYGDYDGWLAVTNVEFGEETAEPIIQEGAIEAIYLPYEDYSDLYA